jgi:hypothetical protein
LIDIFVYYKQIIELDSSNFYHSTIVGEVNEQYYLSFEASKFCQTSKNAVMSIGSIQNSGVNQFKIAQYCATFQ